MSTPRLARFSGRSLSPFVLLGLVLGALTAFAAAESQRFKFSIPAAPAAEALVLFSDQSGQEVIYAPDVAEGIEANAVEGEFTAGEALAQLVRGKDLVVEMDPASGAFLINRKKSETPAPDPSADPTAEAAPPRTVRSGADDVIALSPFEVNAAQDRGYAATETLAGTRLASEMKNVAAQVTVMTPEFLDDIAATTLEDALLYSLNVENQQEYNNDAQVDSLAGIEDLTGAQRVRGLANASNTRDFFGSFFALDSYNSERFTFNSGPNAILFGLGSPGGVIDTSLKRARFSNSAQIKTRVDSFDGYRASFDINREIIPGMLAVRGDFLYDHQESWRKPSRDRQRRQYLTATFRPFEKTTVRASYENVQREASRPRNTLIRDYVTPYLAWREQTMAAQGITDPLDPRLYWAPTNQLSPGEAPFTLGGDSPFRNLNSTSIYLMTGQLSPGTPDATLLNRVTGTVNAGNPIGTSVLAVGPHQLIASPDNIVQSLTDESIYPYDINPGGLGTDNHQSGDILNLSFEQQIGRNFSIEAAYQHETYEQYFVDWMRGLDQALRIDVNRYLPNAVGNDGKPVLNPNRGKYYIESFGRGNYRAGESDQSRVTASYKLDFTERSGWTRWFGRHDIAVLADLTERETRFQNSRTMLFSDSPDVNIRNPNVRNDRQVVTRTYLDTPGTGGIDYFDINSHVSSLLNEPYGTAQNVTVDLRPNDLSRGIRAGGSVENTRTNGAMFAIQSQFWEDRIVATYGRRTDRFKSKTAAAQLLKDVDASSVGKWYGDNFQDVSQVEKPGLSGPVDIENEGTRETRGIVLHPFSFLSVHYNESSNSSPSASGRDPNGGFHAPSTGDGEDYGFTLRLIDSRVFVKFNWYENAQTRNPSAEFDAVRLRFNTLEQRLEVLGEENPSVGYKPSSTWDSDLYLTTTPVLSDFSSKGLEISLITNITPNWRVSLTAAKSESVETNIAEEWFKYAEARKGEWEKFYAYPITEGGDVSQGDESIRGWVNREIYFKQLDLAELLDGRPSQGVRKWRVNLVTNYDFTAGILKNIGVGGAMRWRDKAVIGLPLITLSDGSVVQDIDNPWYDDGLVDFDGWVSYRFKLGKSIRGRVQLNVRNVFDSRDLLPQAADSNGVRRLYTIQSPRQFIFSTTFNF